MGEVIAEAVGREIVTAVAEVEDLPFGRRAPVVARGVGDDGG